MRIVLLLAALLVLTAGCTGEEQKASAPARSQAASEADKQAAPEPGKLAPQPAERQLARAAQVSLAAADVGAAAARVREIAVAAGGFSGSAKADATSATVGVTVPNGALDSVVAQFSGLGRVTQSQQTVADVTDKVVDVESRLENARRSVERVRALFVRANTIGEITSLESQLTSRESDLEALQAQRNNLAASVAMSTVTATITRETAVAGPAPDDPGFLAGLGTGWRGFLDFGRNVLHTSGVLLPFAALIAIPLAAGWWLWRRRATQKRAPGTQPG